MSCIPTHVQALTEEEVKEKGEARQALIRFFKALEAFAQESAAIADYVGCGEIVCVKCICANIHLCLCWHTGLYYVFSAGFV
jgi:hypothetical protein